MRKSNTSVDQFNLGNIVERIHAGAFGIPEFQRDFDWGVPEMRSLLATVFAGWPAGSLLLLESGEPLFRLRPMEAAPPLGELEFAVLDGQQRLTSLYQALYGKGETLFAVRWDLAASEEDIEEAIVSFKRKTWDRDAASLQQQLKQKIIPVEELKTPSQFFEWRDRILEIVESESERSQLKSAVTDVYTYRLSALHDYEFPVVKISKKVEPSAISRIFEKVNRTGLTLNTFDLMVAKSFEVGWNLRDEWLRLKEDFPSLARFFGDDGLPVLQAVALLERADLRQSAVLDLSRDQVQGSWRKAGEAAFRVIEFLRDRCGVGRKDLMPYPNMVPPLIALEVTETISKAPDRIEQWFWNSGFASVYDAAANTRLVSHYRALREGRTIEYKESDGRVVALALATKKSDRAVWTAVMCAAVRCIEDDAKLKFSDDVLDEIEVSQLFSLEEIAGKHSTLDIEIFSDEHRGALNSFLVPRRFLRMARVATAERTIQLLMDSEFRDICEAQLRVTGFGNCKDWPSSRASREDWIEKFINDREAGHGVSLSKLVEFESVFTLPPGGP